MKKVKISEYRKRADKYFLHCDAENAVCDSKNPIVKPYTLSGLLCELELTRSEFFSLSNTREGRRFVNYVLMKIEAFIEENALSGRLSASFASNSLKYSFGWCDKAVQEEDKSFIVSLEKDVSELGE